MLMHTYICIHCTYITLTHKQTNIHTRTCIYFSQAHMHTLTHTHMQVQDLNREDLIILGLEYSVNDAELKRYFEQFGEVAAAEVGTAEENKKLVVPHKYKYPSYLWHMMYPYLYPPLTGKERY